MQFYLSFWIAVWENYLETYFLIFLTIYPLIKLFKTHTTYPLIFLVRLKNQRANSQPCMFIAPPYFKSLHATPHFTHPHCIPPHCTTTHHPFDKYNRRIYNIYSTVYVLYNVLIFQHTFHACNYTVLVQYTYIWIFHNFTTSVFSLYLCQTWWKRRDSVQLYLTAHTLQLDWT